MVKIGIPLRYTLLDDGRSISYLVEEVRRTFQKAGALIVPILPVQDIDYAKTHYSDFSPLTEKEKENINQYLDMIDGMVFPGGKKVSPYDQYVLEQCVKRNIPTLGICLGMQIMSCYQREFKVEIIDSTLSHYQENDDELTHKVKIQKDSLLYEILQKEEIIVNSFHRYHITENDNYSVSAMSEDGIIEGIEMKNQRFHLGVQWHPEISYDFDDNSKKIIDEFIKRCGEVE